MTEFHLVVKPEFSLPKTRQPAKMKVLYFERSDKESDNPSYLLLLIHNCTLLAATSAS